MCNLMRTYKSIVCMILSVLLVAVLIILSSFTSVFAYTVSSSAQNGEIHYKKEYYNKHKAVCDKMIDGIMNMESSIDIKEYKIPKEEALTLLEIAYKSHPDIFYLSNNYSYSYSKTTNLINYITPKYKYSESEVNNMRADLNNRANEVLSLLSPNMTQLQKALIIHDEIILNCDYEETGITAYDVLVGGRANCQGYSAAFSYLLSFAGMSSEIIDSQAMNHEWNKICVDGSYYNVDLTWDDTIPDKKGHVGHEFFLLSDNAIKNMSFGPHYDFDGEYFSADNTKYDNLRMHDFNTRFCYNGSDFYVIDNNGASEYKKYILQYDPETDNVKTLKVLNAFWEADENHYWLDGFSSLEIYNGALYYNTADDIYMYDAGADNSFLYPYVKDSTLGGDYYGLIARNGKLFAVIGDNPNGDFTIVCAGSCYENPFGIGETRNAVISYSNNASVKFGDVDCDSHVSIKDVTLIQKKLAAIIELSKAQEIAADVNHDGRLNIVDATDIEKYLVQ